MVTPKELAAQMQSEGKKVITLILKQKYLNAICAGRKVQEFREVRPTTYNKLILHDEEGFDIEDENGLYSPNQKVHFFKKKGARKFNKNKTEAANFLV